MECSRADTSILSKVTGGSFARSRATNVGVSVPHSCSSRIISSMFYALRFDPMRLRICCTELEQPPLGHLDVVLGESGRTQISDGHRGQHVNFVLDDAKHLVNDDAIVVDARIHHIGFSSGKIYNSK